MIHPVIVASDLHFGREHRGALSAFSEFVCHAKPRLLVLAGDVFDLACMSLKYRLDDHDGRDAIAEIRQGVGAVNFWAKKARRVVLMPGNHEARWRKAILGLKGDALRDARGLDFHEQLRAQGLSSRVEWLAETSSVPGLWVGKQALLVYHGDRQASGFGAAHVAAKSLRDFPGCSTVVGHHHRLQMSIRTCLGKHSVAISNGHLSGTHDYKAAPVDWQRGFTLFEFWGSRDLGECELFTPHPILMQDDGSFCFAGRHYKGGIE